MPLDRAVIGLRTEDFVHTVDARWTMAYAAALGDSLPVYLDTARPGGVVAHPLFAICPEWPVALASRELFRAQGLTLEEQRRAVHANHDCHIVRLVRPGDVLTTHATVLEVEARRPGAFVYERFDSLDADGELVARTYHGMLMRGVEVVGEAPALDSSSRDAVPPVPAVPDGATETFEQDIGVGEHLAHVYSECARIWNPVHTDRAVALETGLPDIILHGSATLALGVSAVVARFADNDPRRVSRMGGEFRAMVRMPSTLKLVAHRSKSPANDRDTAFVNFELFNAEGNAAISRGHVTITA